MRAVWVIVGVTAFLVCSGAVAETQWPGFQATLGASESTSAVKAKLPDDVNVSAAAPGTAPDRARFLGKWDGWMCRNATSDTKAAFEKIEGDDVTIVYAVASARLNPYTERVKAKFVGNEVHGQIRSGAEIIYRMRADGNLDIMWRASNGTSWCSGVLAKATGLAAVQKELCGVNVTFRFAGTDPREGIYVGAWRSLQYVVQMCGGFGVEKVNGDGTATLMYFWGSNPLWGVNEAGTRRYQATMSENKLTVSNPKMIFNLKGAQADGIYRDDSTAGSFAKQQ